MANGVTHWGVEDAKNGSNNGTIPENKNKTIYYYAAGALTLLLAVKLLSSDFFRQAVDFSITYLPFILLLGVIISNVRKYHKHPERGEEIRKNALHKLLYLLLITLLFYILYSPGSFIPIGEAISKFSKLSSVENYFLILSYVCVIVVSLAPIAFFIRVYQKSNGYYKGSLGETARHLLYSTFFVFVLIFISSILTYPSAYAPITGYVSDTVYAIFLKPDNANTTDNLAQARILSIKSALNKTYNNLTENFSDSSEKLSTTIADTKSSLDTAITRTNKSLKNSLSEDIEAKFDISGGILEGDLTIEDDLVVGGQSTFANIVPTSDDAYDLGSVTKGWDNIYVHALHGSSIITVGDGSSSHSLSATDDFLVSGDFEVNGDSYLDGAATIGGAINLDGAVTFGGTIDAGGAIISNMADPANPQDAVTKAWYLANTPAGVLSRTGTTLYPTTSGDSLDMLNSGLIVNIGNAGTDFTSGGGLTLAGVLTASSASAHTIGSLGIIAGDVTGITSLNTAVSSTELGYLDGVTSAIQTQFSNLGTMSAQNSNIVSITGGSITGITDLALTDGGTGASSASSARSNLGLGSIATQDSNSVSISGGSITGITDLAVADGGTGTSNGSITGTGVLTMTPAAGNNFNVATSGAGNFAVNTTELVVDTGVGVGIGTAAPSALLDLQKAGTAKSNLDIFELTNSGNAADMDATSTSLLFNQFYYDASTPAVADAGRITVGTETDWTSTATTQDSYMAFNTALDGNITEGMRINSSGQVLINALQSGAQTFPDDAGVTQWVDLPITSAAASTVESYAAMLDGSAVMTIYGTSNGSGGVTTDSQSVGIMTATPAATLHVVNNEGAGATNQGLLLHLDNTAFAGSSSTASNNGGGLVVTADAAAGTGFDFISAISAAGGTDDTEFRVNGQGDVYGDGAIYNVGADYAEFFYTKNTDLSAGELVCVDVANKKSVKRCNRASDLDLIGIISTKPAFVGNNISGAEANLGETNKNYKLVGLIGQVPAKVTNENGEIKSGDSLTSSSKPGYAMKASAGDSTVGVALEGSNKEDATITVLISRRNKSLTVEQVEEETTRRIAEMNIEDEVSALISDKINVYDQSISTNSTDIDNLETEIADLKTDLQTQITELQNKTNTELNLAQIDLNKSDIALIKQTLGMDTAEPGDISIIGKIAAKKIVVEEAETGKIAITTVAVADGEKDSNSIGKNAIKIGETSIIIETEAVKENSKVFVTPKNITEKTLSVTDINDGDFKVEVSNPAITEAEGDLEFDWLVVGVEGN